MASKLSDDVSVEQPASTASPTHDLLATLLSQGRQRIVTLGLMLRSTTPAVVSDDRWRATSTDSRALAIARRGRRSHTRAARTRVHGISHSGSPDPASWQAGWVHDEVDCMSVVACTEAQVDRPPSSARLCSWAADRVCPSRSSKSNGLPLSRSYCRRSSSLQAVQICLMMAKAYVGVWTTPSSSLPLYVFLPLGHAGRESAEISPNLDVCRPGPMACHMA